MLHVAALAFPFSSHPGNLFRFLCRLATAAPNITISFLSTAKSNSSLFTASSLPQNIKPFDIPDGLPDGYVLSGNEPDEEETHFFLEIAEEVHFFLGVAEEGFRAAMAEAEQVVGQPVRCMITDPFFWFTAAMAEETGAMWVPLWTPGASSLCTYLYTDTIRETVGMADILGRENEILKVIPGFPELRLGDLQHGILFGNLDSPFSKMLDKMRQNLHKATVLLVNSFEGLEPEANKALIPKFKKLLNIGPLNLTCPPQSSNGDPYECISWLDQHKPASVAYLGFGTILTPTPKEVHALAEALEATRTPFLWSLREKSMDDLPEGFLERTREIGKIVSWTPQVKVLEHCAVGVFINHCGWNSVLESFVAGVPVIGRPFFAENHLNAWMFEEVWKLGLRVDGGTFTKNWMISALETVFKTEKGKNLKEQSEIYKEMALKAVEPHGSSTENFNTFVQLITTGN